MVLMNLFARQQWRKRHKEQTYGPGERGGDSEMYGKSNMETYIIIFKIANSNLLYGSGNSNRGFVSTQKGGMGREMGGRFKREGIYVHLWLVHNKLWKILKEMGIPDHLTWLLKNLYAGQETTVRTGHGTTDWFQIGKGVRQGCILSPCLFNLYAECIMRNAGL